MARLSRRQPLDRADLAALQRPRDDLVAEARDDLVANGRDDLVADDGCWTGMARFVAVGGAFRDYERLLRWRPLPQGAVGDVTPPQRWLVDERISFHLATPLWSWLFSPLTKRALRHPRPA